MLISCLRRKDGEHAMDGLIFNSSLFIWSKDPIRGNCFIGEQAELEGEMRRQGCTAFSRRGGQWGFWMESQRTKRTAWFAWSKTTRDADGDVVSTTLVCQELDLRCVVFND